MSHLGAGGLLKNTANLTGAGLQIVGNVGFTGLNTGFNLTGKIMNTGLDLTGNVMNTGLNLTGNVMNTAMNLPGSALQQAGVMGAVAIAMTPLKQVQSKLGKLTKGSKGANAKMLRKAQGLGFTDADTQRKREDSTSTMVHASLINSSSPI